MRFLFIGLAVSLSLITNAQASGRLNCQNNPGWGNEPIDFLHPEASAEATRSCPRQVTFSDGADKALVFTLTVVKKGVSLKETVCDYKLEDLKAECIFTAQ